MSLPDGAEYWNDIKRHFRNKHTFTHLSGLTCGHKGGCETWDTSMVDCYACKALFTDDIISSANKNMAKAEKRRLKRARKKERDKKARYVLKSKCPMCSCGEPMIKRTNRATKEKFWGCWSWPDCSKTTPV